MRGWLDEPRVCPAWVSQRLEPGGIQFQLRVWDMQTGARLLCYDSLTSDYKIEFCGEGSDILVNGQAIISILPQQSNTAVDSSSP